MKNLAQKQQVSSKIFYNPQQVESEMNYRGLPENQRLGFAKQPCYLTNCPKRKKKHGCDGHVRLTTPERAYELGIPLWRRVNSVDKPRARCSIYNVTAILNIVYEFECRSNPEIALRIALVFRAVLIRKGFAPFDLPIFISGGGVHIIINIPQIDVTKETAKRWNRAIEKFTQEKIDPLFQAAKESVQGIFPNEDVLSINLEGHDIARLLSSSGDWRPSTHDEDVDYLKNGVMRTVYEDQTLVRNEWERLKESIEKCYQEIENDEFEKIATMYQLEGTPDDDDLLLDISPEEERKWRWWLHAHKGESTANALRRKIIYKTKIKLLEGKIKFRIIKDKYGKIIEKRIDRSKLINQIIFILCDFCNKHNLDHRLFIKTFATVINECSGNKYDLGKNLNNAIRFYILKWEEKEKREHHSIHISSQLRKKSVAKMSSVDSIRLFFERYVELQEDSIEEKSVIFEEYIKMCKEYGFSPIGNQQFTRVLSEKGIIVKTQGKNRTRCYAGIKMKQMHISTTTISSIDCSTTEDVHEGNSELSPICKKNLVYAQDCAQHIHFTNKVIYQDISLNNDCDIIFKENQLNKGLKCQKEIE